MVDVDQIIKAYPEEDKYNEYYKVTIGQKGIKPIRKAFSKIFTE